MRHAHSSTAVLAPRLLVFYMHARTAGEAAGTDGRLVKHQEARHMCLYSH